MREDIREKLIKVAKGKKTIYYSELGINRRWVGEIVGDISIYEREQGRPLLSAVVVRKDTKMPGEGFWGLTYETQSAKTGVDRRNFWKSELNKVYNYWQKHDPERPRDKEHRVQQ